MDSAVLWAHFGGCAVEGLVWAALHPLSWMCCGLIWAHFGGCAAEGLVWTRHFGGCAVAGVVWTTLGTLVDVLWKGVGCSGHFGGCAVGGLAKQAKNKAKEPRDD